MQLWLCVLVLKKKSSKNEILSMTLKPGHVAPGIDHWD